MRVGAAHHRAEQHAGQLDVVDVRAAAADEARVLLAQARRAQALQLRRAVGCLGGGCHGDVSSG
jgi:hypothetical protein